MEGECVCVNIQRDEQSQAVVSADARGCSTRTNQTNRKDIQSPVGHTANETASRQTVVASPSCWDISTEVSKRSTEKTRTHEQSIAPTSGVLAPLNALWETLMPGFVTFVQRTAAPAATAGPKD